MITERLITALFHGIVSEKFNASIAPTVVNSLRNCGQEGALKRILVSNGSVSDFLERTKIGEQLVSEVFDYRLFLKQAVTFHHSTGSIFLSGIKDCGLILSLVDDDFSYAVARMSELRRKYHSMRDVDYSYDECDAVPLEKKLVSVSHHKNPDICSGTRSYPAVLYEDLLAETIEQKQVFHDALSASERKQALSIFQYADKLRKVNSKVNLCFEVTPQRLSLYGIPVDQQNLFGVIAKNMWDDTFCDKKHRKVKFGTASGLKKTLGQLIAVYTKKDYRGELCFPFVSRDDLTYRGRPLRDADVTGPSVSDYAIELPKGDLKDYLAL